MDFLFIAEQHTKKDIRTIVQNNAVSYYLTATATATDTATVRH